MIKSDKTAMDGTILNIYVQSENALYTKGMPKDLIFNLKLSKRTPCADFAIKLPAGIYFNEDAVSVNVIGRGYVLLKELNNMSSGRCGIGHEVQVGQGAIVKNEDGSVELCIERVDLRPDNGIDVQVRIRDAILEEEGVYSPEVCVSAQIVGKPEKCRSHVEINVVSTVSDFRRESDIFPIYDTRTDYQSATFQWTGIPEAEEIELLCSGDLGATWQPVQRVDTDATKVQVQNLEQDKELWFRLRIKGGSLEGLSNIAKVYSGMYNIRSVGNAPTDGSNAAMEINQAINYIHELGGGTILFEGGHFCTTTVYLKSNVYLFIDKTAQISALRGCDDEEMVWYSDEEFRKDQSHMSRGPYLSPDNWMTKQDAGHSYWHNALFFGERLDNVKIIGNGRIDGLGNLTKSNTVMDHESGFRADKLVALKLCTNVEVGGLSVGKDLWYQETDTPNADQPFYLDEYGKKSICGIDNMLHINNAGHFAVLATGVDGISTHDVYAEKGPQVRDVFDYMGCNDILAFNIYAEGAPDDVIKLGSDCSLGFTRPSRNCIVRNIIGDTSCNLFQIGSETADDIQDVCIDNIYVLASNKAGFSISVNDGGHIRNIHLNCGGSAGCCEYGTDHGKVSIGYKPAKINPHKSIMRRIRTPLFISLSNRGRVLGGEAIDKEFIDDIGIRREELLVTNVNIGSIENVCLKNLDISEVYGASQAKSETDSRWPAYENQARTTALIVGYKIPDGAHMTLPDGSQGRSIENVLLEDIDMIVKGGNPLEDAGNTPRELGVGQFNLRNLAEDDRGSKIPAYGYYIRHVKGVTIRNCSVGFEENDDRHAVVLDDVTDIQIDNLITKESMLNKHDIKII